MPNLFVQEQYTGDMTGDSGVYETGFDNIEELFAACVEEHGEFTGDIFIDAHGSGSNAARVGWTFKRDTDNPEFDPDDPEMGLHTLHVETWVTVHNAPPTTVVKYDYFSFDDADGPVPDSFTKSGPDKLRDAVITIDRFQSLCSGCGKPVAGEETCHDYCTITL